MKVILASSSPWRRKILEKTGIPFTVETGDYEEDMTLDLPPDKLARTLALGKAKSVAIKHTDALVIGADVFAVHKGELLGKPHTPARAMGALEKLSGKWHDVYTGVAVVDAKTGKSRATTVHTRVHFRKLSYEEIAAYVATGEPLEAAGSYTAQEGASSFIDRIEGDFWAVVGLPPATVVKMLRQFGVTHSS